MAALSIELQPDTGESYSFSKWRMWADYIYVDKKAPVETESRDNLL